MSSLAAIARFAREKFAALERVWSEIWFQSSPTAPLDIARIGIGVAMLLHYALASPYLFDFWGDTGWMARELILTEERDSWTAVGVLLFQCALAVGRLSHRVLDLLRGLRGSGGAPPGSNGSC